MVAGASVTGLAKRMEKAGLIERKNDETDERLTMLQIPPAGVKPLEAIREIQELHVAQYLQAFPQEQKEVVLDLLKQIVRKGKQLADPRQ